MTCRAAVNLTQDWALVCENEIIFVLEGPSLFSMLSTLMLDEFEQFSVVLVLFLVGVEGWQAEMLLEARALFAQHNAPMS